MKDYDPKIHDAQILQPFNLDHKHSTATTWPLQSEKKSQQANGLLDTGEFEILSSEKFVLGKGELRLTDSPENSNLLQIFTDAVKRARTYEHAPIEHRKELRKSVSVDNLLTQLYDLGNDSVITRKGESVLTLPIRELWNEISSVRSATLLKLHARLNGNEGVNDREELLSQVSRHLLKVQDEMIDSHFFVSSARETLFSAGIKYLMRVEALSEIAKAFEISVSDVEFYRKRVEKRPDQ